MRPSIRRRSFLALVGGTAAGWPLATGAQQVGLPVVGFLHQGPPEPAAHVKAFRVGLSEVGVGNIKVEDRAANGEYSRLPGLAADLVGRRVAVIAANFLPAALAAKAATQTIPVAFLSGSDPIAAGLVSSFNRPTANVTGIAYMFTLLGTKNLELLRQLVPKATIIGAVVNPTNPNSVPQVADLQTAARALGQQLVILNASTDLEIDAVFASLAQRQIGALLITADGFLIGQQDQLVALAARYAMPTMYPLSQYVVAGGLIGYGANLTEGFRLLGNYTGRILKGEKPADLPVLQPTRFQLVLNLKTARSLSLEVPPMLLALTDEVIE